MKATNVIFSLIVLVLSLIDSINSFGIPTCIDSRDLDILWTCYEDKTKYYQCIDIERPLLMPCGANTWFNFDSQGCIKPSDWKPSFDFTNPKPKLETELLESDEEIEYEYYSDEIEHNESEEKKDKKDHKKKKIEGDYVEVEENGPIMPPIKTIREYTSKPAEITTKNLGPPTRRFNTRKTTKWAYPTPPTPVPTAPELDEYNEIEENTEKRQIPTKRRRIPTARVPIKSVTAKVEDDDNNEDDDEKDKPKRKIKKPKFIPTRLPES